MVKLSRLGCYFIWLILSTNLGWVHSTEQLRSAFEYVSFEGDAKAEGGSIVSMFNKAFHQCSISESCTFVVQDVEEASYQTYKSREDLPTSKKNLIVFRKQGNLNTSCLYFHLFVYSEGIVQLKV